jgi:hypothetical protein
MAPVVQDHVKSMDDHGKRIGGLCRRAALASVVGMLAACAEPPPPPPPPIPTASPAPRPVVVHRRPPAQAKRKLTSREQAVAREEAAPAEPQPELSAGTEPATPVPSAGDLVGLDEQRAAQLLGPAAATDARSPATVWHYKSSRCELDLAFYMEMRSGRMRTLHYDFKRGAETPEQRRACLKAIIEENHKGEPS